MPALGHIVLEGDIVEAVDVVQIGPVARHHDLGVQVVGKDGRVDGHHDESRTAMTIVCGVVDKTVSREEERDVRWIRIALQQDRRQTSSKMGLVIAYQVVREG